MSVTMTLKEAQANLADVVHQLSPGDSVVITENDQPVAKLVSEKPAPPAAMTQEEWRKFILETAGSITDPSFVRPEQGEFEQREELP